MIDEEHQPAGPPGQEEPAGPGPAQLGLMASLRALPRPVIPLLVGVAVNRSGSLVSAFLVLYLTSIGYPPGRAGIALSAFGFGTVVGILLGGQVADRLGHRHTIGLSSIANGLLAGSIPFVHAYGPLLAVCAGAGLMSQLFRPAAVAMLAELTPPQRLVLTSAAYRVSLNVGATLGPLLAALLLTWSFTALFLANLVGSALFGTLALLTLPRRASAPADDGVPTSYAAVLADWRFLLMAVSLFAIATVEVQYLSILPITVRDRGLPPVAYSVLVALNGLLVILVELPLTRVTQTWPIRRAILLGTALIAVGISLYGFAATYPLMVAFTILWTMGEIVSAPSAAAYPALAAPSALRGRYIATATACQTLGYAVGPAFGTLLFQYTGSFVWIACAALGSAAVAMVAAGVRQPRTLV
jgi:predicted MFS family arabinose efflux permease